MATVRPDLAAQTVNGIFPYLADRILPVFAVEKKVGNIYYQALVNDSSAQTGRTAGAAPTAETLAASSDTYSCAEVIDRVQIPDDDTYLQAGNLLRAQQRAARVGMRNVYRAKEAAAVALLLNRATFAGQDILDSLMQAIDDGIKSIDRVPGRVGLACGWTTFRRMTRYEEVTDTFLRTGPPTEPTARRVRNVDPATLATVLGVDEIMVGDDDHWTAGSAFLFKIVDAGVDPVEEVQLGRTVQFWPAEASPFMVESFYSDNLKTEVVDVRAWYDQELYAVQGGYVLEGIDEGNAVTTTTTGAE